MAILKSPEQRVFTPHMEEKPLPPGYKPFRKGIIYTDNDKALYESKAIGGQIFDFHLFPIGKQIIANLENINMHDQVVESVLKNQIKLINPWPDDIAEAIKIIEGDWGRLEPYLVVDPKGEQIQSKQKIKATKTSMIEDVIIGGQQFPLVIVRKGQVMPVRIAKDITGFLSEKDTLDMKKHYRSLEPLSAQYSKGPSQIAHIDFVAGRK